MAKEDLMKDIDKIAERKKPIEKIKPKKSSPVKSKPEAKPKTKEVVKLEKDAVKIAPKKEEVKQPEQKIPVIEYEIQKTTKFDLNWFYFKKVFLKFEKWLSAPYTKEYWRKKGFVEKPKIVNNTPIVINPPKSVKTPILKGNSMSIERTISDIPKSISTIGDFDKPLTPDEILKIKRIRALILSESSKIDENIFESDK